MLQTGLGGSGLVASMKPHPHGIELNFPIEFLHFLTWAHLQPEFSNPGEGVHMRALSYGSPRGSEA